MITDSPDSQTSRKLCLDHRSGGTNACIRAGERRRPEGRCQSVEIVGRHPLGKKTAVEIEQLAVDAMLGRLQRRKPREPVSTPLKLKRFRAVGKRDAFEKRHIENS